MGLDVSPGLKLATFELQQVHPVSDHNMLREIALTLEDVLRSVTEVRSYPPQQS